MKWNKKYTYPTSTRALVNDERIYDVSQEKLPSVTTILSATQPQDKLDAIAKWKARVGDVEADRDWETSYILSSFTKALVDVG